MRGLKVEDPTVRAMCRAYTNQRARAIGRGIAFEFTFEEWRQWWLIGNRWSLRGRTRDALVMARCDDGGPYSPENVYCTTQRGNYFAMPREKRRAHLAVLAEKAKQRWQDPWARLAMRRGAQHPRSRPVKTQAGIFANATLAAEAFEITRQHAARLAREKREGWEYV